jgi:hypothetical protein
MKKLILATTILALAGMNVQTAKAGDREWATVGKVLTGVAAVGVIANALDCPPARVSVSYSTYAAPTYTYCPPPARVVYAPPVVYAPARVVYAPPPVVVYPPPVWVAPQPVVHVRYGHFRRHGYGHGHHGRW